MPFSRSLIFLQFEKQLLTLGTHETGNTQLGKGLDRGNRWYQVIKLSEIDKKNRLKKHNTLKEQQWTSADFQIERNYANKPYNYANRSCYETVYKTDTNHHDSINRIPFVVTYNPALPHVSHIRRSHFNILLSSNHCREVFKQPSIVAYRRNSNLRGILVKPPLTRLHAF